MEKRDVLKGIMLPLAVILAVALCGCESNFMDSPESPIPQPVEKGVLIGPMGGVVTAMDGEVVMTIPADAIQVSARFSAYELKSKYAGNYALKTIVIEPLVAFSKPVQLTLRYNGCLGNGLDLYDAESVSFLIWNDEATFNSQVAPTFCPSCVVNGTLNTICNCIDQTGVIATIAEW